MTSNRKTITFKDFEKLYKMVLDYGAMNKKIGKATQTGACDLNDLKDQALKEEFKIFDLLAKYVED